MKKLTLVTDGEQVNGNVLEHTDDGYCLRTYQNNAYGNYDVVNTEMLDDFYDVIRQKNLAARIKRLHNSFPRAEYVASSILFLLNLDNEDVEEALKGVINF